VLCEFVPVTTGKTILGFKLSYLPYYAGLALFGAYIYERRERYTRRNIYVYMYLVCSAVTAYLVHEQTFSLGTPSEAFFVYQSPITMLGAASLFVFASGLELPEGKHGILLGLSSSTYTIYLMHPLLLDILGRGEIGVVVSWNTFYPIVGIPLVSVVVFSICACGSIIWRKIVTSFRIKCRCGQKT